jgi:hypothetical protein
MGYMTSKLEMEHRCATTYQAVMIGCVECVRRFITDIQSCQVGAHTDIQSCQVGAHTDIQSCETGVHANSGMDINMKYFDGIDANTCLHIASWLGHINVVELLLDHGIDTTIKNSHGKTASEIARTEAIRELIDMYGLPIIKGALE